MVPEGVRDRVEGADGEGGRGAKEPEGVDEAGI